jgi:putative transposase
MSRHMHGRNLRAGRVSIPNQVYAITTVTRRRSPFFSDLAAARKLVGVLQEQAELQRATTLAYVVMPDHLHWLMQLSPGHDLSAVVRAVKSVSSRRIGRAVWQRGFHDHALRDEDDVKDWARYIVANPVRAGLVKRVGDYPHWDAVWL